MLKTSSKIQIIKEYKKVNFKSEKHPTDVKIIFIANHIPRKQIVFFANHIDSDVMGLSFSTFAI